MTRLRRIAAPVVWLLAAAAHAGSIAPPELPTPLRSADLRKWTTGLKPSDAQRAAIEQAFDVCIEDWQRLRDGTVRPAETKLAAAPEDEKSIAAWRLTLNRASDSMAASERTMFAAMRAACGDDTQRAEVDRLAAARARRRAAAAIHTLGVNLPRVPSLPRVPDDVRAKIDLREREWELSATPTIERLAGAVLEGSDERERDLARRVLLTQRAAARDIAALLPKDVAERYLRAFRRRAMPPGSAWSMFEMHTPESLRERLDAGTKADALAKLDAWQRKRDELQEQALDALVAAGAPGEMLAALSDEYRKLNDESLRAVADSAGMPELAEPSEGVFLSMDDGGEDAGGVGLTLPDGASGAVVMATSAMRVDGATEPAEGGTVVSNVVMIRAADAGDTLPMGDQTEIRSSTIRVQASSDDVNANPDAGNAAWPSAPIRLDIGEAISNALSNGGAGGAMIVGDDAAGMRHDMPTLPMRRGKPLSRRDIEAMRVRLAVPDDQRAVWDALADDALQAQAEATKPSDTKPMSDVMPAAGQSAESFVNARAARRAELARIEEAWFDGVKAGVPGVSAEALANERSRRALQRALSAARTGGMLMPMMAASRASRIDLDAAADSLSPEGRRQAAAALAAWRADLTRELDALAPRIDEITKAQLAWMQTTTTEDSEGKVRASMNLSLDEKQMEQMERARKPVQDAWKRVESLQQEGVRSVSAAIGEGDAKALRRAVLKQTHPEAFRSQEQVDAALNRVLALQGLSTEALQAVSTLGDQYRQQSDLLVERSIERTDRADAAMNGLLSQDARTGAPLVGFDAVQTTERNRSDAGYDREELNARALRRLRAALTPEQAAAAKLD